MPDADLHGTSMKKTVSSLSPRHVLAGVEAGVLGVIYMLACAALGSIVDGRSIWLVPNLFASIVYGADAFQDRFVWTACTGVAILILVYGLIGAAWGCAWRENDKPGLTFFGGIFGLGIYYLLSSIVWKRISPMLALYAPDRQLELGHILWGMVLAKSPGYARRIAQRTRITARQSPPPSPEPSAGEVII